MVEKRSRISVGASKLIWFAFITFFELSLRYLTFYLNQVVLSKIIFFLFRDRI